MKYCLPNEFPTSHFVAFVHSLQEKVCEGTDTLSKLLVSYQEEVRCVCTQSYHNMICNAPLPSPPCLSRRLEILTNSYLGPSLGSAVILMR